MYTQRCHMLLFQRNARKLASLKLDIQHVKHYRPSTIYRSCSHIRSSIYGSNCNQSVGNCLFSCSPDNYNPHLNVSARSHHTLKSDSSLTAFSINFGTNVSSQCGGEYFHNHQHSKENKCQTVVSHLMSLIAGLGLSYATYKILTNIFERADLLPSASCSSHESNLRTQSSVQEENCVQPSPSKPVTGNSDQIKIGREGNESGKISLQAAIERAQKLCLRRKEEVGSPGIVVCVSVDGKQIYAEGFGYADVENQTPLKPNSVLRIASISKAITAAIVAKAWEKGQIDIDKAVQHYVPGFPHKEFMGEKVEITVRQLLSHSSGIRHYKSADDPVYAFDQPIAELVDIVKDASFQLFYKTGPHQTKTSPVQSKGENEVEKSKKKKPESSRLERDEYYLTKHYSTTEESLTLFANDPLVARPGTRHVYTTFAYTLLAAAIEAALKASFTTIVSRALQQMSLRETYLDLHDPIIYNRARYYVKNDKGCVVNARYLDNSYKWAGGGLLSTVEDVVKFGNILLYSAQHQDGDPGPKGFLKSSTIWKCWTPQGVKGATRTYGLGFEIRPTGEQFGMCDHTGFGVGHTGGAIGASSVLFILPRQKSTNYNSVELSGKVDTSKRTLQTVKNASGPVNHSGPSACEAQQNVAKEGKTNVPEKNLADQTIKTEPGQLPQGVVVCVILNMISVSVKDVAEEIANIFQNVDSTL